MTTEAEASPATAPLPGVWAYLRSVYELGRRSLLPAAPVLAFLFLYRAATGAYGELTNYSEALKGHALGGMMVAKATPILFLALIHIPFLPLQESILRGHPIDFLEAIRRVLRMSVSLILLGIAYGVILLGPVGPMTFLLARVMQDPLGLLLWTGLAWMAAAAFFMIFAIPAVVLDREGPLQSLRTSVRLISRNFWTVLGRLRVLALLAFVNYAIGWPLSGLGPASAPIKVAVVTLTSALETLLHPFWVAAVLVLYRSLRPWDQGIAPE